MTFRRMKGPTFCQAMAQNVRACRVLDNGTVNGPSAIAMAEALPDDGTGVTYEINAGFTLRTRKPLGPSPHGPNIEVLVGQALEHSAT